MAENTIKLNSLGVIQEVAPQYYQIGETVVTVQRFIPYEKVLDMIQWCIDYIINDRPFISAPLKKIIKDFAILKFFTNFDFTFLTEYHDMSDIYAEYDFIARYEVLEKITPGIDPKQLEFFNTTLDETLESIMKYRNSAVGIIDALAENAEQNANAMQKALDIFGDDEKGKQLSGLINLAEKVKK